MSLEILNLEFRLRRFTLEEIVPDSSRIRNVSVRDLFFRLHANGESEIKTPRFGHVSEDFESEFKKGTLDPKTVESGELCCVNDVLSNPDIFSPATFRVCGRIKMADLVVVILMPIDGGHWLPHSVTVPGNHL